MTTRCGFVSIVGRPNVGKSTLLNTILKRKVAIVSKIPQTTRNQIRGIYNEERGQIVFLDTPGMHLAKDRLDQMMNKDSLATLEGADCVIHVTDPTRAIGPEERMVVDRLKTIEAPVILAFNKADCKPRFMDQYISLWEQVKLRSIQECDHMILLPISAKTGVNIAKMIDLIFEKLPSSPPFYPLTQFSDIPQPVWIGDIIREKFLDLMRQEIPHALAVVIENMTFKASKVLVLQVAVYVERPSQKEIVIGKKGQILKKVGTKSRQELEQEFKRKIFLELNVKVKKNWRDNSEVLERLGYDLFSSQQ